MAVSGDLTWHLKAAAPAGLPCPWASSVKDTHSTCRAWRVLHAYYETNLSPMGQGHYSHSTLQVK